MNLKNSNFNYNIKYKSLVKYLIIALPILLLLIACIFPSKKVVNTYALEETTTTETDTNINFNQIVNYSLEDYSILYNGITFEYNATTNYLHIYGTCTNRIYLYLLNRFFNVNNTFINYGDIYLLRGFSFEDNIELGAYNLNYSNEAYINFCYESMRFNPYININSGASIDYYFTLQVFNLSQMGLENISLQDFNNLFPLNIYSYNNGQDITLTTLTITNNIGNAALNPLETQEIKEPNQAILKPLNLLYKADINNWYDSFLNAFRLNYEDNDYMYYLVHFPLYVLYVCLLDLLLDIILLVPALIHRLVHRYKGDD